MSKSLGNGIDPLDVIEKYGADALRLTLVTGNAPGNDMRFYWERVENSRNFANKVWNASRYIMMNLGDREITEPSLAELKPADRWILSLVNTLTRDMTVNMDKFELGVAVQKVYDFIWEEFCDWYIEISKVRTSKEAAEQHPEDANAAFWTLKTVLTQALKLLHPFMPFITEEIYCTLNPEEETIMTAEFPKYREDWSFPEDETILSYAKDLVKAVRQLRSERNVPPSKKSHMFIVSEKESVRNAFQCGKEAYMRLGFLSDADIQDSEDGIPADAVSVVIRDAVLYIPMKELVDLDKEEERLRKEKERLLKELQRSNGMLSNEKFLSKAPAEKIAEEKEKLAQYQQMMKSVEEQLAKLGV